MGNLGQEIEDRALARGIAEGMEMGRREGVELGRQEGIELGKAAGMERGRIEGEGNRQAESAVRSGEKRQANNFCGSRGSCNGFVRI